MAVSEIKVVRLIEHPHTLAYGKIIRADEVA
jgi:hypothetical protein